ncbi:MAG TPA: hypothetical protein VMS31_15725 [Pyrinomonadaceae bacterium]|nr:hypothetical protein [Pyrinomonadaceae bacterium]
MPFPLLPIILSSNDLRCSTRLYLNEQPTKQALIVNAGDNVRLENPKWAGLNLPPLPFQVAKSVFAELGVESCGTGYVFDDLSQGEGSEKTIDVVIATNP